MIMNEFGIDILSVKVGSSMLVGEREDGTRYFRRDSFQRIGSQLMTFADMGIGVITTTSGAMAAGQAITGSTEHYDRKNPDHWAELQRLAGIGQQYITRNWQAAVGNKITGLMLITRDALHEGTDTRQEALRTAERHLAHGDLLFINENDAIAHDEIAFGDNDILGAIFAKQAALAWGSCVKHVSLTDTNGIYLEVNDPTTRIPVITDIEGMRHVISADGSGFGDSGMAARFDGANITLPAGVEAYVTDGNIDNAIALTLLGEMGTRFALAN